MKANSRTQLGLGSARLQDWAPSLAGVKLGLGTGNECEIQGLKALGGQAGLVWPHSVSGPHCRYFTNTRGKENLSSNFWEIRSVSLGVHSSASRVNSNYDTSQRSRPGFLPTPQGIRLLRSDIASSCFPSWTTHPGGSHIVRMLR